MNVLDLALKRVKLRKVSGTKGGEWQGPCPGCGGDDRFHVWPNQNEGKGAYWCRGCDKSGDNIQFLRDFEGLSFREACAQLNVPLPDRPTHRGPAPGRSCRPEFVPDSHSAPPDLWQERADKFVAWAQQSLDKNPEALSWLAGRGISREVAHDFRLGWNIGEEGKDIYRARKGWGLPEIKKEDGKLKALWIPRGLVIPYAPAGVIHRIRIRRTEGEPRYYVLPGSGMSTMIIGSDRRAFVVVEAELDAIAVAAHNHLAGAVSLGSVAAKPDADTYQVLQEALQILLAIDYDEAGKKAATWWKEQFERCDRWPVPQGKDPGEAYRMGIDLDQWIKAGLPPALVMESAPARKESKTKATSEPAAKITPEGLHPAVLELYRLLKDNPGVVIITKPERFTVLRNGKYVGGRINELVFRVPEVLDYIDRHPEKEITGGNFMRGQSHEKQTD